METENGGKKDTTSCTIGQWVTPLSPASLIHTSLVAKNLKSFCSGLSQIPSSQLVPVPSPPVSVPAPAYVPSPALSPAPLAVPLPSPTPAPAPTPTTTDIREECNFASPSLGNPTPHNISSSIPTCEALVPIDPALQDKSYPWMEVPPPALQEESLLPHPCLGQPKSDLDVETTINTVLAPVTSVPPPASSPAFNFSHSLLPLHSPNSTPTIPTHWPEHMAQAYQYFTKDSVSKTGMRDWGVSWLKCLQAFIDFQKRASFPKMGPSLPPSTSVQPPEIAVWMKYGQHWKDYKLNDVKKFGQQWWDWWHSLQPKARAHRYQNHSTSPMSDMDWSCLQKLGRNGIQLLIISLIIASMRH